MATPKPKTLTAAEQAAKDKASADALRSAQTALAQAQADALKAKTPSLAIKEDIKTGIGIATEQGFKDLGRLGESADIQAALDVRRQQLSGLTGAEQQAQRDVALRNINRATEGGRRQLSALQSRQIGRAHV